MNTINNPQVDQVVDQSSQLDTQVQVQQGPTSNNQACADTITSVEPETEYDLTPEEMEHERKAMYDRIEQVIQAKTMGLPGCWKKLPGEAERDHSELVAQIQEILERLKREIEKDGLSSDIHTHPL